MLQVSDCSNLNYLGPLSGVSVNNQSHLLNMQNDFVNNQLLISSLLHELFDSCHLYIPPLYFDRLTDTFSVGPNPSSSIVDFAALLTLQGTLLCFNQHVFY